MFGFDKPEDGAYERYFDRLDRWKTLHKRFAWARHHVWWVIHNCVSHPLIGFFPFVRAFFRFHDWTSHKMNPQPKTNWYQEHLERHGRGKVIPISKDDQ